MKSKQERPGRKIQEKIFADLLILVTVMTVLITTVSMVVNIRSESRYLDQNLQNMAESIARSQIVQSAMSEEGRGEKTEVLSDYLHSLEKSLSNIDVISIVGKDSLRRYHTHRELTGTVYEGNFPEFSKEKDGLYVTDDTGPSGSQRRAYAAVYDDQGNYQGFVLAIMLKQNIRRTILNTALIHIISTGIVIICAAFLSRRLSRKIKDMLQGYEPDAFSAMFRVREDVLESLNEGVLAVSMEERLIYMNKAAQNMLHIGGEASREEKEEEVSSLISFRQTMEEGRQFFGLSLHPEKGGEILADLTPVRNGEEITGALCILHDRTEYTKLMEELTGVRYMVESMRASNHDFVNKLHVILGLIQMGNQEEASRYIMHIASVQQNVVSAIMKNIEDSSVAALLIGKHARASELNIRFVLEPGSRYSLKDVSFPPGDLVTIMGNLMENAMDAMDAMEDTDGQAKELCVGIFSQPHELLIHVDDSGPGILPENQEKIFAYGFSTKGENRGTGMYVVKKLVDKYRGRITLDSEPGVGSSFSVELNDGRGAKDV